MFTLSFYRHGSLDKTVIGTERYSVEFRGDINTYFITTHGEQPADCEFRVGPETDIQPYQYVSCYVTNEQGKTIDTFQFKHKKGGL